MKSNPESLAQQALKRLIDNNTGRNCLKSLPTLITPKLYGTIYNRLFRITSIFEKYMQKPIFSNLRAVNSKEQRALIETNYILFTYLKKKTRKDWLFFFKHVPLTLCANNREEKLEYERRLDYIRQLVNQEPLLAIISRPCLLLFVKNPTVEMIVELFSKTTHHSFQLCVYKKIRHVVNQSADSQFKAIISGLHNKTIVPPRPNIGCLFEQLKSKECIYEWVRRGEFLEKLPTEFLCDDQVLLEVLRLGNTEVFKKWEGDKTEAWYLKCLGIAPHLIRFIEHDNQTPAMRDLVLSQSMDFFPDIAQKLQTEQSCRAAIEHNFAFLCHVDEKTLSSETVKNIIDRACSTEIDDKNFYSKLGKIVSGLPDIQWYLVEKANDNILCETIKWLDDSIIEYIAQHNYSWKTLEKCFDTIAQKLSRDKLEALILRYPRLVRFCEVYKIPVSEQLSVEVLRDNVNNYRYCKKTPKILEIACQQKYDIKNNMSSNKEKQYTCAMFFSCPELFPYIGQYYHMLISSEIPLDFKKCAIIFLNVDESKVYAILCKLFCSGFRLLYECFSIACGNLPSKFSANWKQNVKALGEIEVFDTVAALLLLSFLDNKD